MLVNDEICKGCIHYRPLESRSGVKACHYCLDTGVPRDCPIESCNKKEIGVFDADAYRKTWGFRYV